uniref:BTB domain-containing protein n=1 Tax=Panagrolaimus superbus TaxID=310955 RepID=A0A914Y9V9_9BILA
MDNNQKIEDLLCSVPTLDLAFRQLSENNIFPDCIIICSDNLKIQAHKRYLCAYSTYFESEFGSDIKNRKQVQIDASLNIVLKLLDFLYTFTIDQDQPMSDTQELLRLSDMYKFAVLKARMCGLIIGNFTTSNVCDLCTLGRLYQAPLIRRAGARFIASNLKEVEEKTPDWRKNADPQVIRFVLNWNKTFQQWRPI